MYKSEITVISCDKLIRFWQSKYVSDEKRWCHARLRSRWTPEGRLQTHKCHELVRRILCV